MPFLQTRLPFENKLLIFLSCLNPDRRSDASLRAIGYVATKLRMPAANIANVSDKWRLYIHDEEIRKPEKRTRVDHYSAPGSKWKSKIPSADKNCEGSLGAAPWKFRC